MFGRNIQPIYESTVLAILDGIFSFMEVTCVLFSIVILHIVVVTAAAATTTTTTIKKNNNKACDKRR